MVESHAGTAFNEPVFKNVELTMRSNMPEKDPQNWALATWMLGVGAALAGGFVNWYSKVKAGHVRLFNFVELVGEIATSGIVGLGVFMLLAVYGHPAGVCAVMAGVGGHMGTRLLFLFEKFLENRLGIYDKGDKREKSDRTFLD
jgi:polyferredoxin